MAVRQRAINRGEKTHLSMGIPSMVMNFESGPPFCKAFGEDGVKLEASGTSSLGMPGGMNPGGIKLVTIVSGDRSVVLELILSNRARHWKEQVTKCPVFPFLGPLFSFITLGVFGTRCHQFTRLLPMHTESLVWTRYVALSRDNWTASNEYALE